MLTHKLISADSHIVEPPDLYTTRIEPKFRDRAPRLERLETPAGRKFDSWVIDGKAAGTLGAVIQAGHGLPAVRPAQATAIALHGGGRRAQHRLQRGIPAVEATGFAVRPHMRSLSGRTQSFSSFWA